MERWRGTNRIEEYMTWLTVVPYDDIQITVPIEVTKCDGPGIVISGAYHGSRLELPGSII